MNEEQMKSNKVLRNVITFDDQKKVFFIVMQQIEGDKLYMVSEFADYIREL